MEIATIGFTQTTAEHFFGRLRAAGVRRVLDVRLHNTGQLAGFAKAGDLAYLCRALLDCDYEHDLRLAPVPELLDAYRGKKAAWDAYSAGYLDLLAERNIPRDLDPAPFATTTALLCSEAAPDRCHRLLLAELLAETWGATVRHL